MCLCVRIIIRTLEGAGQGLTRVHVYVRLSMATELEIAVEEDPVVIGSEIDIQSPVPSPKQDDSVLLETDNLPSAKGEREVGESTRLKVGSEGGSDDSNAVSGPDRLQRFYFESDALVLKNNAE